MGKHTSRISLWGNRSRFARLVAVFAFLAVTVAGALLPFENASAIVRNPYPEAYAAFSWTNPSTMKVTGAGGIPNINFIDANINDADPTYFAEAPNNYFDKKDYEGCNGWNGNLNQTAYVKLTAIGTGTLTYIQQRDKASKGTCAITNRAITIADTQNGPKDLVGSTTGSVKAMWINDATISVTNQPSPPTNFVDSNPNDNNRTFTSKTPIYCADGAIDTLSLITPTAGTFYDVVTPSPKNGEKDVQCTVTAVQITITNAANGNKATACAKPADCAAGNAAWTKGCANFIGPVAPGSLCSAEGSVTPMPAFAPTAAGDAEGDKINNDPCASLGDFDFKWAMCPALTATAAFAGAIDDLIEDQLHYDTTIFDRSSDRGKSFYAVWSTFRTLALAVVVIAGLIMVVSQGTGMQFFDAYTVRKVLPRLLIAVIAITLSWPILQFIFTFFNDLGSWMQDIILQPFQAAAQGNANKGIAGATGWATVIGASMLGSTAYLAAIGPLGIASLMGTILLALLVGWVVLTIRNVVLTILIIFAPLAIACYILPSTKKVFDFWENALQTLLMVIIIIMALIAAGKALSIVTPNGIMKVLFLLAPYFFLPFAFKLAGGLMATIFSIANDRGKGGFDRMRNVRANERKQRAEKWQSGSLWRDNAFARPINALGKSVGAYKSGAGISAFAAGTRGRSARALYDSTLGDKALKNNDLLNALQNNDDANAVLGMSGGTVGGLEQAARDLFRREDGTYNEERGSQAIAEARAVGVNRANALAAAKTSMANKARAFGAGNVQALDRGVRRLARSEQEYDSLAHSLAFFARDKGRADLGGTNWISYGQNNNSWQQAQAVAGATGGTPEQQQATMWQSMADSNMMNGLERTGVGAILGGHDNQTAQYMQTLTRVLQTAPENSRQRLQAAMTLKEVQGNIQSASGGTRDVINRALYEAPSADNPNALQLDARGNIADQLAARVGTAYVGEGRMLTTMGRTYQEYSSTTTPPPGAPGGPGGPPP